MDFSTKFFLGLALLALGFYLRYRLSVWYDGLSQTIQFWVMFAPPVLMTIASVLEGKEFSIGGTILWLIAWGVLWAIVMWVVVGADTSDALSASEKSATGQDLATFTFLEPRYTFADVEGMSELKTKLRENADAITTEGKNGILFHGAPGNGKTFIAEAFAGDVKRLLPKGKRVAYLSVSMSNLASRWLSQTTEQLRSMFVQSAAAAKRNGACVLFIDEIDSLLVNRETIARGDSEETKNVNAMLTLLVEYRDFRKHGIIIVAATNHLDKLDAAAIREGRFDFKTEISAPDFTARTALLMSAAKAAKLDRETAERAAIRWEGFGVARMRHVGELAGKNAAAAGRGSVAFEDLMAALREAQGCKGSNLPEGTPALDALHFDDELTNNLKALARRMTRIADIEAMGGSVPKGVLFYGPPGTGKTAVAKALAISSGWAFLSTTGQKLMNDANELEKLVNRASDLRPCIIFIDEADDILADRASNPYGKSATNNLLALVDGDRALKDVMFVAATNFEEALDAAAIRGGRFAEHFEFRRPDGNALVSIIRGYMSSKQGAPWAQEFTPDAAAEILDGLAPADAKDRIQKAINRVVSRLDGSQITLEDLRAISS